MSSSLSWKDNLEDYQHNGKHPACLDSGSASRFETTSRPASGAGSASGSASRFHGGGHLPASAAASLAFRGSATAFRFARKSWSSGTAIVWVKSAREVASMRGTRDFMAVVVGQRA